MITPALEEDGVATGPYARILKRLKPHGGRLLEFGCRDGRLLCSLSDHFEAYGYDGSAVLRGRCRVAAPDAVVLEDWQSLPRESFDVIVSLYALAHLKRPLPVFADLARRLSAGGVFLFVVPNPGGFGRRLKRERWFAHPERASCNLLSRGEWVMMARQAGLEIDWVRGDGMWDLPYFEGWPLGMQRVLFGVPDALQRISPLSRPILPAILGECLITSAVKLGLDVAREDPARRTG